MGHALLEGDDDEIRELLGGLDHALQFGIKVVLLEVIDNFAEEAVRLDELVKQVMDLESREILCCIEAVNEVC
jgi:hypothetical protein